MAAVHGLRNPALAALAFFQSSSVYQVDEASFKRVAEICGDAPPEVLAEGFVVKDLLEDVTKLCDIGKFVVYMETDGKVYAKYIPPYPGPNS